MTNCKRESCRRAKSSKFPKRDENPRRREDLQCWRSSILAVSAREDWGFQDPRTDWVKEQIPMWLPWLIRYLMLQEVKVAHNSSSKKMGNEDRRLYFISPGSILWSSNQTAACTGVSQWTHCQFRCNAIWRKARSHNMPLSHGWKVRATRRAWTAVSTFYETLSASILPLDSEWPLGSDLPRALIPIVPSRLMLIRQITFQDGHHPTIWNHNWGRNLKYT